MVWPEPDTTVRRIKNRQKSGFRTSYAGGVDFFLPAARAASGAGPGSRTRQPRLGSRRGPAPPRPGSGGPASEVAHGRTGEEKSATGPAKRGSETASSDV